MRECDVTGEKTTSVYRPVTSSLPALVPADRARQCGQTIKPALASRPRGRVARHDWRRSILTVEAVGEFALPLLPSRMAAEDTCSLLQKREGEERDNEREGEMEESERDRVTKREREGGEKLPGYNCINK